MAEIPRPASTRGKTDFCKNIKQNHMFGENIMEMIMYRQATKVRDGGQTVYKGEDALPFVGQNIFVVADGMGGAAAIRHTKFDSNIFDEDKIFDVMFKEALPDADEETVNYVKKAFFELYAVKDCYFSNALNMKKSGYFGSRTCVASFIYFAKKMFAAGVGNDLEKLHAASDECKAEMMEKIGRYFTENIKKAMITASESAKLTYEGAFKGLALMGTTLCGTIFIEREDEVDALYLVAGDSRPFQWDSAGLKLVVEDQKRADGGMTNYIKANGDFTISAKFYTFKKPCILFNASDGVYESCKFSVSELGLEKLLLETILDSNDMIELKAKLEDIFVNYGTHDDSSTIALKTFGYEGFDDLKEAASERLKKINEEYIEKMPDFLDTDYKEVVKEAEKAAMIRNNTVSATLFAKPSIREYCKNKINGEESTEKIRTLSSEISAKISEADDTEKKLIDFLCDNVGVTDFDASEDTGNGSALIGNKKYCQFKNIRHITAEEATELTGQLLKKNVNPDKVGLSPALETELKELLQSKIDEEQKIVELSRELEKETEEASKNYWLKVSSENDVIDFALSESLISEDEAQELIARYPATLAVDDETAGKAAMQTELCEKYDTVFYSLIKENN